jgi:hypothetical protein
MNLYDNFNKIIGMHLWFNDKLIELGVKVLFLKATSLLLLFVRVNNQHGYCLTLVTKCSNAFLG